MDSISFEPVDEFPSNLYVYHCDMLMICLVSGYIDLIFKVIVL